MRNTRLFKRLPTAQEIQRSRLLKPFARYLHHHSLWQFNRRAVAGGVAVGLFFGILTPFAQILFSAIAAVIFRVNLPVAAFSTLVTNPLTFPLIYYFAYKLGGFLTQWLHGIPQDLPATGEMDQLLAQQADVSGWLVHLIDWAQTVGLPLITGLIVLAVAAATCGYFLVNALWRLHAIQRWRKRRGYRP